MRRRHHAQRIGEREVRLGIGIQDDDPQPVRRGGRQHHWIDRVPDLGERARQPPRRSAIGERGHAGGVRRQRLGQQAARDRPARHWTAKHRITKRPQIAKHRRPPCAGPRREKSTTARGRPVSAPKPKGSAVAATAWSGSFAVPSGRDWPGRRIDVVVAGQRDDAFRQGRIRRECKEELGPLAERPASVRSPVTRTKSSGCSAWIASSRARVCCRRSLPRGPARPLSMRKP